MEAIVLAGGLGTRLRGVISDIPKPMADLNGRPFLSYILDYLDKYGIGRVILSTGYKHEIIEDFFGAKYKSMELVYQVENEPLGTGGAIKAALKKTISEEVFILNGDTYFQIDLHELNKLHKLNSADLSIALKPMQDFDRYGTVEAVQNRIIAFHEKKYTNDGTINGGIYLLNTNIFDNIKLPGKFSFETEFLQLYINQLELYGFISDNYFIDIGIPEDYLRAQVDLGEIIE